ncbi:hypothetical protein DKG77_03100 [Flagellimonas aquimarina]|uniref:DUF3575 domain-containing protein n=1 Tax=Flagellimonas aquimarina TaxID=2201895 RepID=A0A316LIB9_9FLAO|nr:hypothetical protein [Allomuricauda koreensis]PWL39830.1 hypothetical protein DKG77_03100 [Allomuricauda koreensis]
MRATFLSICYVLFFSFTYGQADNQLTKNTKVGFELDALPYITGGYYASVWVGHDHFRYRAIIARAETPDFVIKDGFTNNEIKAYAAVVDYFFKRDFKGWWIGTGLEYWDSKIQTDAKLNTANYNNTIFTVGGGHVWKFYKNFYLNPWVAAHLRLAGDKEVVVDESTYDTQLFIPEISLKLGWHF